MSWFYALNQIHKNAHSWSGSGKVVVLGLSSGVQTRLGSWNSNPLIWHLYSDGGIYKWTGFIWVFCHLKSLGLQWREVTEAERQCMVSEEAQNAARVGDPADWPIGRVCSSLGRRQGCWSETQSCWWGGRTWRTCLRPPVWLWALGGTGSYRTIHTLGNIPGSFGSLDLCTDTASKKQFLWSSTVQARPGQVADGSPHPSPRVLHRKAFCIVLVEHAHLPPGSQSVAWPWPWLEALACTCARVSHVGALIHGALNQPCREMLPGLFYNEENSGPVRFWLMRIVTDRPGPRPPSCLPPPSSWAMDLIPASQARVSPQARPFLSATTDSESP